MTGLLGRLLLATCLAAALNFAQTFYEILKRSGAIAKQEPAGFSAVTVCYFGPPAGFYPRFLILVLLALAVIGVLRKTSPRSLLSLMGLTGALACYGYWGLDSYRVYKNLTDAGIDFLHNPEIRQVAYLYGGNWLDVGIAAAVVVCLALVWARFAEQRTRPT
jgi:hypothetical protein